MFRLEEQSSCRSQDYSQQKAISPPGGISALQYACACTLQYTYVIASRNPVRVLLSKKKSQEKVIFPQGQNPALQSARKSLGAQHVWV